MSTTWIRPSGTPIELDDKFDKKALKALGWKKKSGPKKQDPNESLSLMDQPND
jgi:hypothetical protein